MNEVIQLKVQLNCDVERAFKMFSVKEYVTSWLAVDANIELRLGGKYELFWDTKDRANNSTFGCRITALEMNKVISFEWKGPQEFKEIMNNADPLTNVTVLFLPLGEKKDRLKTELHLIHTGWRNTDKWDEAKLWFANAWASALNTLKKECTKVQSNNTW